MAEKIGKNMILINAPDFQSMAKAFKMIPITKIVLLQNVCILKKTMC
jgi:hypothetical protein